MSWIVLVCVPLLAVKLGCASGRAASDVVLVKDGQARAVIVCPPDAPACVKWAAEELQSYVKQMSGAQVEIVDNQRSSDGATTRIVLQTPDQAKVAAAGEGYRIVVKSPTITITGESPRGTMYGAFTLLEQLGVRWWTPSETTVPQRKTIRLPAVDLREVPRLEYRDVYYIDLFTDAGLVWSVHNKVNGLCWKDPDPRDPEEARKLAQIGGRYAFVGNLVHSYMTLLRQSGQEIKPEMMALIDNKRKGPGDYLAQPCLSSPDTLMAMVAGVVKAYKERPNTRFVVVGQEDNIDDNYCHCPQCLALVEQEGASGLVVDFANRVVEAVEKEVPGACIVTAAYHWSRHPPKTIKPRPNVFITLCSIECDFGHPLATSASKASAKFREDLAGWSKITTKLFIWDYVVNFRQFLMPHPNLDVLTANARFFADSKVVGVFEEGSPNCPGAEFSPLRRWVLARSLWNPDVDGPALVREFLEGYYGPAAPAIEKYIDVIHRLVREDPQFQLQIAMGLNAPYLSPAIMAECEAALREADARAKGRVDLERRVRHAHMPVWYTLSRRGPASATWKAVEAKIGGRLDPAEVMGNFVKAAAENKAGRVREAGAEIEDWSAWLRDETMRVGDPMPPEPQ